MMPTLHLTDKSIKSIKPGEKQIEYWDSVLRGLVVRASPGGKKSFYTVYRNSRSERRRLLLGDCQFLALTEARRLAREVMGAVARGDDPAEARREYRDSVSVADLCEDFLRFHATPKLKPSFAYKVGLMIERDIKPVWGHLKAADVRRRDVIRLLDDIGVNRAHPVHANRVRALVSKMYNFGIERELVETSPCIGLPKPFPERARERVLTDNEIVQFWQSTGEEEPVVRDLFRLLLLLGQRSGETKAMQWAQIRDNTWHIPSALTKSGQEQAVPLPLNVHEIIESHRSHGHSAVFVARFQRSIECIQKAKQRIASRMEDAGHWTAHDLRRTCSTGMEKLGVPEAVVASVLNHSKTSRHGVTAVYARHRYLAEKRAALLAWTDHVFSLVEESADSDLVANAEGRKRKQT